MCFINFIVLYIFFKKLIIVWRKDDELWGKKCMKVDVHSNKNEVLLIIYWKISYHYQEQ